MNEVLITNYTSDTTDTTDVPIYVQNDALLMHEKTPREVTRSQCSLPIVLYVTHRASTRKDDDHWFLMTACKLGTPGP